MRMDQSAELTAERIVNTYPVPDLARVLLRYGEEKFARRIAEAIAAERAKDPIVSTLRLSAIVKDAIPAPARRTGGNPAKRTFQALRIEVNDELGALRRALPAALDLLAPGGRVAALAYHSLEDRLVKRALTERTTDRTPPGIPLRAGEILPGSPTFRLLTRGAERPADEELTANPRSASARLRAAERIREAGGSGARWQKPPSQKPPLIGVSGAQASLSRGATPVPPMPAPPACTGLPLLGPVQAVRARSGAEQDRPDRFAAPGDRGPAPDVAERVDHLQASAGLLDGACRLEHRGAVRRVKDGANHFAGTAEQAKSHVFRRLPARGRRLAADGGRVGQRVRDELADDRLRVLREEREAPVAQGAPGEAPSGARRLGAARQRAANGERRIIGRVPPVRRHPHHAGTARRRRRPGGQVERLQRGMRSRACGQRFNLVQTHGDPEDRWRHPGD
jgi:hypothetical protein